MAFEHDSDSVIAKAVRASGSQSAFARLIGKRQSVINAWLKAGRVSHNSVLLVEAKTGIPRHELRPDLHPRDAVPAGDVTRFEHAR